MFEIRDEQYAELRKQVFTEKLLQTLQNDKQTATQHPVTKNILVTDARYNTTELGFDPQGFIGSITSPLGRRWHLENNAEGKLLHLTNPAGSRLSFTYNAEGEMVQVARDQQPLLQLDYFTKGYPKTITFADHTQTQFQYSDFLKITQITDRRQQTERYQYDDAGDLTTIQDGNGHATRFEYSVWNRPDTVHYADGSSESYHYNPKGLLQRLLSGSEPVAELVYDEKNRVTEIRYSDGNHLCFSYDAQGHLVEARNPELTVTYTYDAQGRVVQEEEGNQVVKYQYDQLGHLVGLTYPSGQAVEFAYDPDSRLALVKDWPGQSHRFLYAERDEGFRHYHPNGLVSTVHLSPHGLPTMMETQGQSTSFALRYQYDAEDRVKTFEDAEFGGRAYEYDAESQLLAVQAERRALSETFAYDGAGNRIRWNQETAVFNSLNQLVQQGQTRCRYDARGHLVEISLPKKRWRYTFNLQNLLVRAEGANGLVVTFGYDAFGRRIWKRCGEKEVRYVWMGETLLGEVTFQAGVQVSRQDYLYKPGTYTPLATQIDGQIYCYHTDHLGTPRRLTNAQGKVVWAADYGGFGQAFVKVKEVVNCLRFPGQYWDSETGLHYNRFRYYLPLVGRYLSKDPIGYLAGLNVYAYVGNQPINQIDPLGLWWKAALSIVAAVAVGVAVVALAPVALPVAIVLGGAAAGAVGAGLNEALNQREFCLTCILAAMGKGALVGSIAALPFAFLPASAGVSAFAGVGAISGALSYTSNWLLSPGARWNWGDFAWSVGIGAVTAGLGRYLQGRYVNWRNSRNPPTRPTWRQSEIDAGNLERLNQRGFREQVSFKNRTEVPYGTKGSTRPDYYRPESGIFRKNPTSVDVKNYNIQTTAGRNRLVNNIVNQAQTRASHLPPGTRQNIIIDARGQTISQQELAQMTQTIRNQSNGLINNIRVIQSTDASTIPVSMTTTGTTTVINQSSP